MAPHDEAVANLLDAFVGSSVVIDHPGDQEPSLEDQTRQIAEWNGYNHDRQKGTRP